MKKVSVTFLFVVLTAPLFAEPQPMILPINPPQMVMWTNEIAVSHILRSQQLQVQKNREGNPALSSLTVTKDPNAERWTVGLIFTKTLRGNRVRCTTTAGTQSEAAPANPGMPGGQRLSAPDVGPLDCRGR